MKAPSCIGYYEAGDDQCDGAQYKHKSKPCLMRAHCRKIQKYRVREKNKINELLTDQPVSEIERFIKHIDDGGTIDSFVHGRLAKTKIATRQKQNTQECWSLYRHFENQMSDRFGESLLANRLCVGNQNLVVFLEGMFYPVDRTNNRVAYVLWYCKTRKGYDNLICKIFFRSRSNSLDISVPIDIETLREVFSETTLNKIKAVSIEQGLLKTTFRRLSYEGVGLTVGCLKRLVDRDVLKLPRKKL